MTVDSAVGPRRPGVRQPSGSDAERTPPLYRRILRRLEDVAASTALALMAIIPLAEIGLRQVYAEGIPGASVLVQNLTLWVGLLGAAVAAREGKLLSLATTAHLFPPRIARWVIAGVSGLGAGVALALAWAGASMAGTEREAGTILIPGLPLWWVEAVLPYGFALVGLRLIWHAGPRYSHRLIALVPACAWWLLGSWPWLQERYWLAPELGVLVLGVALGVPIFALLGGAALILFWNEMVPLAAIPAESYRLLTSPLFPALPLFTLTGAILAASGTSRRLVRIFSACFAWLPGGVGVAAIAVCTFFTSFTGASGVTILALGGLLLPMLLHERYPERTALGLLTGSGSLGLLFAPSLPIILYAIVAKIEVKDLFVGAFLPGVILTVLMVIWALRRGYQAHVVRKPFDPKEAWAALRAGIWEVALPIAALAAIFSGYATLVEAAAFTVLYTVLIERFVYRDLRLTRDMLPILTDSATIIGGVLIILAAAAGLTSYLIDARIPALALDWVRAQVQSPLLFLLLLNGFLIMVGFVMDIFSAILVVVPLIVPMGDAFGIDPIHLGVIFLANLELGFLTPPVGLNLFLAAYRFDRPLPMLYRAVAPVLIPRIIGLVLITYVSWLSTGLVQALLR